MNTRYARIGVGALSLATAGLLTAAVAQVPGSGRWVSGGGDIHNTRNAANEKKINTSNVGGLVEKWNYTTQGDVSATPTVDGNSVYVVDWGGYVHAVDAKTGAAQWSHPLSYYTGNPRSVSRTSPVVQGNLIILGDQGDFNEPNLFPTFEPGKTASVMAIDKNTGEMVWRTFVSDHLFSMVTSSPVAHGDRVYVGICSFEEAAGLLPFFGIPYGEFTFRGSVVALDTATGKLVWRTYMAPDGYTGAAVWGSTPVVDTKRGSLYVATGNNYSIPPAVEAQIAADPANGGRYLPGDDLVDAVVSMDLETGAVKWGTRVQGADTWHVARGFVPPAADPAQGPDYDFGSGPNLYTAIQDGKRVDLLGAGQKSGRYWALNPDTGAIAWVTQVGPGGLSGGIQWGSAVDGNRVYCAVSNSGFTPWTLGSDTYRGGLWAALDAATGVIQWKAPDLGTATISDGFGGTLVAPARAYGMVTSANGVVYAGSTSGKMSARDAATGATLWEFDGGGAVVCGPSVVNGTVYWGTGYGRFGSAFGSSGAKKVYAFGLP